jgi:TPR repeat protein
MAVALDWWTTAAKLGAADVMRDLGLAYMMGLIVAVDTQLGLRWYGKAADHGDAGPCTPSRWLMGKGRGSSRMPMSQWHGVRKLLPLVIEMRFGRSESGHEAVLSEFGLGEAIVREWMRTVRTPREWDRVAEWGVPLHVLPASPICCPFSG